MDAARPPDMRMSAGSDAQTLIEKIVRLRIRESRYWNEHCFGLTSEKLIDKAVDLRCFGGVANETNKPTPFLCLLLKMLHLQPELAIVLELVRNEEFKYVRVLGAFYLRLMANSEHVYRELEPLLMDYRKLAKQTRTGWELTTMDQVAEELLARPICCEIALPRLASRKSLVAAGRLEGVPRESSLRHQFDAMQLILKRQDDAEQGEEDEQHARRKRARGGAGE